MCVCKLGYWVIEEKLGWALGVVYSEVVFRLG